MTAGLRSADPAPPGSPVFISFASEDLAIATRIRSGLETAGLRCWMAPRDIEPGTSFPAAITAAVAACRAVVLLLTEASNASPHVLSEVELAFNARKPILAILIAGITPSASLQYFISTTHWFDAESEFDDDDLARLKTDLERLLAGEQVRFDQSRRRRSRRNGVAAAIVAALVVAAVFVWMRTRGASEPVAGQPPRQGDSRTPDAAPVTLPATPANPATGTVTPPTPTAAEPAPPKPASPEGAVAGRSGPDAASTEGTRLRSKVSPTDGQTYVWIPPGRFSMGCSPGDPNCQDDELPTHAVRIAKGFWLARTEVTAAQYSRRKGAGRDAGPSGNQASRSSPVTEVTWADAKAYCASVGGRLPTEAEWEYAARAGETTRYYDTPASIAWFENNSDEHTHPVGQKEANAFGLHDMLGNVYEWVLDRYYNKYDDSSDEIEEPLASNASGVARGGAWTSGANDIRVSNRFDLPPDAAEVNVGFRCARSTL